MRVATPQAAICAHILCWVPNQRTTRLHHALLERFDLPLGLRVGQFCLAECYRLPANPELPVVAMMFLRKKG
jgi:hypothetical protein